MSSTAYERGMVLYQQGRYDLAGPELRKALAGDPDDPYAHALLAVCLVNTDRNAEGLIEADEAVRLAPDTAFCHYVRGHALIAVDRLKDAEDAAGAAVVLDPDDPDFRGLLAHVAVKRKQWAEALAAADGGLALDPTHAVCLNLRGMALVQLGRAGEAVATLGDSLADDPENGWTHANQGWAYLHQGEPAKALEHFREALRLDPDLEWASQGVVEALKARHFVYRWMLAFFLWSGRQSQVAQWGMVLGFVFGRRLLAGVAEQYPRLAPLIYPIIVLSLGFMLMTWAASPLFNLVLMFNKFGRMALTREQKREAFWVGGCFLLAVVSTVAYFATGQSFRLRYCMQFFALLVLPLATVFQQTSRGRRRFMVACTAALVLAAAPVMSVVLLLEASPFAPHATRALELFGFFTIGCIASSWFQALPGFRAE